MNTLQQHSAVHGLSAYQMCRECQTCFDTVDAFETHFIETHVGRTETQEGRVVDYKCVTGMCEETPVMTMEAIMEHGTREHLVSLPGLRSPRMGTVGAIVQAGRQTTDYQRDSISRSRVCMLTGQITYLRDYSHDLVMHTFKQKEFIKQHLNRLEKLVNLSRI